MKKLSLTSLLIVCTIIFSSCSNESDPLLLNQSVDNPFAKKTALQRNADGSYFVDYELNDGVKSDITTNASNNSKSINLYASENALGKSYNEELSLNGQEQFVFGINNTLDNSHTTLTILDDDIKFSRVANKDHLRGYKVTDNLDKTYTVDFTVKDNIAVDFVQNNGHYEIHLKKGTSNESDFSRTFTKVTGEDLNIVFVNHYSNGNARLAETTKKKPRIIVVTTD